jgi:hypothetical protein
MERRWTIAALLFGVLAALAVATAVAQVSPALEPASPADAGAPEPDVVVEEAVAVADAGTLAPNAVEGTEPDAAPTVADVEEDRNEGTTDGRRVISRRREAALVGGWVRSELDAVAGTVAVDDLGLGANGEWVRRRSTISDETGLAGPPEETNGAWFTQESELILLARGSAVDEVLRATFQIDDRSERLVLELPSGPTTFFRYR